MAAEVELENARKEIEKSIKSALLDRDMTQAELANLLGESRAVISLAVSGSTTPSAVKVRKKIYKVLGIK